MNLSNLSILAGLLGAWLLANWLLPHEALDPALLESPPFKLDYQAPGLPPTPVAQRLHFDTAEKLERELQALSYTWPPGPEVPAVEVDSLPEDLDQLPVPRKKALFFRSLLPMVLAENRELRRQRAFVQQAFENPATLDAYRQERLQALATRYRVKGDPGDPAVRAALLRRIDTLPAALVLAQAANESGWGTSRFARQGNNLFGMWTYDARRGLTPSQREQGARHSVRAYRDLGDSVRHYMLTLNTHPAYADLRRLRKAQRDRGEEPDALALTQGLLRYSERGEAYVEEIRRMIRGNRLHELAGLRLGTG